MYFIRDIGRFSCVNDGRMSLCVESFISCLIFVLVSCFKGWGLVIRLVKLFEMCGDSCHPRGKLFLFSQGWFISNLAPALMSRLVSEKSPCLIVHNSGFIPVDSEYWLMSIPAWMSSIMIGLKWELKVWGPAMRLMLLLSSL